MKYIFLSLLILANLSSKGWGDTVGTVTVNLQSVQTVYDDVTPVGLMVKISMSNGIYGADLNVRTIPFNGDESNTVNQFCLSEKAKFEQGILASPSHIQTIQPVDKNQLTLDPSINKG